MKSDSEYSNPLKDAETCPHGNFKINPCEACESETTNQKEVAKTDRALKETFEAIKDIAKKNPITDGVKKVKDFFKK